MFPEECKNFINQYVSNDHTNRALYLHAPHGHGKTHFLKEELSKQENISYKCIMVSLSGITTLAELSKAIFLVAHQFKNTAQAKRAETVSHIIAKNVAAQFNIDLSLSEKELQTLYDVVNFRNRLLVIDDVECAAQIPDFWGYIKGLLFDDVKILLVSSEPPPYDKNQYVASVLGDKIRFQYTENTLHDVALQIINAHPNNALKFYRKHNDELAKLVNICKCNNLHILRFALEKTCTFLQHISISDSILEQQILKSMLLLSPLYIAGEIGDLPAPYRYAQECKSKHVNARDVIYHSCLSYLTEHYIDETKLQYEHLIYLDCVHLDREDFYRHPVLSKLRGWSSLPEAELHQVLSEIQILVEQNQISWLTYPHIVHNIQDISTQRPSISFPLKSLCQTMKHNIQGTAELLQHFHIDIRDITGDANNLPPDIVADFTQAINQPYIIQDNFTYKQEDFYDYFLSIQQSRDVKLYNQRYLSAYNSHRFSAMFQQPTEKLCEQMKELMGLLYSEHKSIAPEELSFLQEFNASLTNILEKPYHTPFESDILHSLQTEVNRWIQHFTQSKSPTSN